MLKVTYGTYSNLVSEEGPQESVGELGGLLSKASQVSRDVGGRLWCLGWVVVA